MIRHDEGFFSAKDNLRLFWESDVPPRPKAHVGIVHGYGDHCGRYRKFIDALVADGFAVHAFDYRGHGQADGRRGYCEKFSEFVDDLETFWMRVRGAAGSKKSFLFAHSHGGLMAIHYQMRKPPELAGLVLSARRYAWAACAFFPERRYASPKCSMISGSSGSSSAARSRASTAR